MNIKELKYEDVSEMYEFLETIEQFGHIYYFDEEKLDKPFNEIRKNMAIILNMIEDSFEI